MLSTSKLTNLQIVAVGTPTHCCLIPLHQSPDLNHVWIMLIAKSPFLLMSIYWNIVKHHFWWSKPESGQSPKSPVQTLHLVLIPSVVKLVMNLSSTLFNSNTQWLSQRNRTSMSRTSLKNTHWASNMFFGCQQLRPWLKVKTERYPLVICCIAIQNGPVEIVDLPQKNGHFP